MHTPREAFIEEAIARYSSLYIFLCLGRGIGKHWDRAFYIMTSDSPSFISMTYLITANTLLIHININVYFLVSS